ncbi:MAG: ATP-dependent helicase, partial [Nocardioides sp.]
MSTNRASATAKRPRYVVRTPAVAAAPTLDADQRSVVDHPGGPLLVLAGPGTGKTTTLVEAVVDRVERRGADPESVLALTFSRKAADQLRERVDARLGRTVASTRSATFHSFAYALVRQYGTDEAYQAPLRLLSAAEQDAVIRELLARGGVAHEDWPDRLAGALRTRGFAQEVAAVIARTQERGIGFERLRAIGEAEARPELIAAARFMADYDAILSEQSLLDFPGLIAQAVALLQDPDNPARDALRERFQHVFVDEYQDTDPAQVALLKALAGDGRNLIAVGDPHQSIYGFRGADLRGILQFPEVFLTADRAPAPVVVLKTTRRFGRQIAEATGRLQTRMPLPGASAGVLQAARLAPEPIQAAPAGRVDVLTFDTERAEAEHIADLLRRAHLEDGLAWSQLAVLVRSGRGSIPALRRVLQAAGVPTETAADETPLAREPAVLT